MFEFLIRRADGEWFDLHRDQFKEVLRPNSFPSRPVDGWGDHRIEVLGCQVSFSCEDPGIQVCFEGGDVSGSKAQKIIDEVCRNIEQATGQSGEVIQITAQTDE